MDNKIEIGKDPATRAQIVKIQLLTIIRWCCNCVEYVKMEDTKKIQEMFDIVNCK